MSNYNLFVFTVSHKNAQDPPRALCHISLALFSTLYDCLSNSKFLQTVYGLSVCVEI